MIDTNFFILYLIILRLAIIIAGVISIILGYKLFNKSVSIPKTQTEVSASMKKDFAFTLKTTAPGTVFALFGIIVISVMLVTGSPEMILEQAGGSTQVQTLKLKGNFDSMIQKADSLVQNEGNNEKAIDGYKEILFLAVKPMNNLAWLYQKQEKLSEALPLAQVAVQISPNDPANLDTLAEILMKKGEFKKAQQLWEKAADINPSLYDAKLKQCKEKILKGK